MNLASHRKSRLGFTLVEMLVVIAIIGMLAGLLIPVVTGAITRARQGAHKLEVDTIAEAVEKYRNKYGDYPPDGSSWPIMERHLRKAFPQIVQSELALLDPTTGFLSSTFIDPNNGNSPTPYHVRNDFDTDVSIVNNYAAASLKVMDPAEALVFFLGGFSADPQRPFTGTGGPFIAIAPGSPILQYNVSRQNSFFDFAANRLTLITRQLVSTTGPSGYISNDDSTYHGVPNDLLPVYLANSQGIEKSAPIVYFDSRTYWQTKATGSGSVAYRNFYQCAGLMASGDSSQTPTDQFNLGSVRPLISETRRLPALAPATLDKPWAFLFVEDKKFQVISPGVDGRYGGILARDLTTPAQVQEASLTFPSGASYVYSIPPAAPGPYVVKSWLLTPPGVGATPFYKKLFNESRATIDNCANFSAATFAQGQP
jgi:prepilin-type N-terminal cleavage/methylation domain-containing protein